MSRRYTTGTRWGRRGVEYDESVGAEGVWMMDQVGVEYDEAVGAGGVYMMDQVGNPVGIAWMIHQMETGEERVKRQMEMSDPYLIFCK